MITKYDIGQKVYFIHKDRIENGDIKKITIDNKYIFYNIEVEPKVSWNLVIRKTEDLIFKSKDELLGVLKND